MKSHVYWKLSAMHIGSGQFKFRGPNIWLNTLLPGSFLVWWFHQEFQVPKKEVLNPMRLFWEWVFPYISLAYSLYRLGFLHFRCLKCLVWIGVVVFLVFYRIKVITNRKLFQKPGLQKTNLRCPRYLGCCPCFVV